VRVRRRAQYGGGRAAVVTATVPLALPAWGMRDRRPIESVGSLRWLPQPRSVFESAYED
jgi:hypothetical protein